MKKFIVATMIVVTAFGVTARSTIAFAGATPIGQLNMAAVPKIDQDGIRKVQTLLKDKGFDPGPIDGVDGSRTTSALRGFQESLESNLVAPLTTKRCSLWARLI